MRMLIAILTITVSMFAAGCASQTEDSVPASGSQVGESTSMFPDLPSLDDSVYENIKKTCRERWQLQNMNLDTFTVSPDKDEYSVHCDGVDADELYHFVIRVDSNGNWINDGRTKKNP